jgi:hypothetical protein
MRPAANPAAPGSTLLHPIAIGALALLLVNDHVLKAAAPGWITGKLSDVAGLALTPVVIVALWRLGTGVVLRRPMGRASPAVDSAVAAIAVAVAFALVKLSPFANDLYSAVIGPTRIDPSDLVALPAAGLGWWVAARPEGLPHERRRGRSATTRQRLVTVGRAVALCLAVFAIAATSPAPPISQMTAVAPDEVLFAPGESSVERHAIVSIFRISDSSSMVIEARSRWPFVEPAPRFLVSLEGVAQDGADALASVWIDPTACPDPCEAAVLVEVSRPGVADPTESSIAWELVVTVRAGLNEGLTPTDLTVTGQGFASRQHALAPWVSVPLALVLAAILFAAGGIPSRVARRGIRTWDDALALAAAAMVAAAFVIAAIVVPQSTFAPAAGGAGRFALILSMVAGLSVVSGTILWWRGSGAALAIVLVSISFIGLSLATRLIDDASATFARSWLLATLALTIIGTIALVGALRRPGRIGGEWISPSRVLVAATGATTVVGLLVALRLDSAVEESVPVLAPIHVAALVIWWQGNGKVLGVTSFVVGAATALRAVTGFSWLLGGPLTGWDYFTTTGVIVGAGVTLLAALDVFASYPRRPAVGESVGAEATAPATDPVPPG